MSTYTYKAEQFLPISIAIAWDFFSSPKNLAKITPAELDFKILTSLKDNEFYEGMIIDYTVKPLLGIPVHWQTEIKNVQNQKMFTDTQLKGPYKIWEHTHAFKEVPGGILMHDEIKYKLPMGFLGNFAHWLFVRKKIDAIFKYRKMILEKIFIKK